MSDPSGSHRDELAPTLVAGHGTLSFAPVTAPSGERYATNELLGRGGMGIVELCVDRRIGRDVARKTIRPELRASSDRFLREALVQARLEHPVFVPVYDVDPAAPSFTMRRIRGRSLREVLAAPSEDDTEPRLLRAFVELCLAVDYAHARGVVHRDIKPDNVMLGAFGEVYLLDWGVAKVRGETEPAMVATGEGTGAGTMLGTPGYMPPEQLRGEQDAVDGRADVYALGATLFELLTRTRMHAATNVDELFASTLDAAEHRPSRIRADVAPELDEIVVHATQPEPERRVGSAREIARAIERHLDGRRDLASRRAHATELAADARAELDRDRGQASRIRSGQRASRALALDPGNAIAREVLVTALTATDDAPSDEASDAAERLRAQSELRAAREYGRMMLLFAPVSLVALLLAGVRSPVLVALFLGTTALAGLLFARTPDGPRRERWIVGAFLVLSLSNAIGTRAFSPWVIVPMAMLGNVIALTLQARPHMRLVLTLMAIGAWLVPAVLDELGVLAPSYERVGPDVVIHPMLTDTPVWLLGGYTLLLVVAGARVIEPTIERARVVEARMQNVAWMLRRIVTPDD